MQTYDFNISSSDDDSDDDLARITAISPKIRTRVNTKDILHAAGTDFTTGLTKSASLQDYTLGLKGRHDNINYTEFDSRDTKHVDTSDSENSDEEINNIEKGIQKSLEQVRMLLGQGKRDIL